MLRASTNTIIAYKRWLVILEERWKLQEKLVKEKRLKNNVSKMKNTFYELINPPDMVEERIYELEDISISISKTKDKNKHNIQLWDNYKRCDPCLMGIPEGEEKR